MIAGPTQVRITAHATPHISDPPEADEFYATLGMFVVAWGRLEGHVIGALLMILGLPESQPFRVPIPMAWEKRLDLWKRAFNEIPVLQPYKDRAITLMRTIKEEAKGRNVVSHAIWDEFLPGSPEPTMEARTVKPQKGSAVIIDVTDYKIALSMLQTDLATANRLNADLVEFTNRLGSLRQPPSGARTL